MTALITVDNVTKVFPVRGSTALPVLKDVTLAIEPGQSVALMGRSGSGKSTLLNLIGLLDRPTTGRIRHDGVDVAHLSESRRARLRRDSIGFVFQQFQLLEHRTAVENVSEPLLCRGIGEVTRRRARSEEMLRRVGLGHRLGAAPHLLSGGEQQRVALARALVTHPTLICADEPTGALDSATGELVLDQLFGLTQAEKVTLILATHDETVAARADRIVDMVDGVLRERPC